VIDVPSSLSAEQDDAVDRLSKVMNGNPRARLFAGAASGRGAGAGAGPGKGAGAGPGTGGA
jgi:hypothetical protein